MTRRPNDQLTPLEQTLTNLPQEPAPADLQDRCLAAMYVARVRTPARKPVPWSYFALAGAASLLILIVATPVLLTMLAPAKSAYEATPTPPAHRAEADKLGTDVVAQTPPAASGARSADATSAGTAYRSTNGLAPGAPPILGRPAAKPAGQSVEQRAVAQRARIQYKIARVPPGPVAQPVAASEPENRPVVPAPAQPWYDRTDERQKIVHRDMTIEAPEVEETYHRVVAAIEKVGGYIEREDLIVQKGEPDHATIAARIPVASFDAVVQQLRDMGKLVKLSGSSEDRTQEYKSRGVDIRALSAAEQDLIQRYETERNESRKQALKWELDALRKQLHDEKQALLALAAETAFAYLNLEIVEGRGVWHDLKEKSTEALPIAMAMALVALPFLVVLVIWRRKA